MGLRSAYMLELMASMKVPPKRKGNVWRIDFLDGVISLNESPSEKEGKLLNMARASSAALASMKVPPKRKGNSGGSFVFLTFTLPQ